MESRAANVSVSGSSQRALANDDERMENYLQRATRRNAARVESRVASVRSNPDHKGLSPFGGRQGMG